MCSKICQNLEDLHNSVKQFFPNVIFQIIYNVIKSRIGRRIFKIQVRPVDFNVREYEKFTDRVSDSTLQPTLKKLPPVEFCYSIKEEYPQLYIKVTKLAYPFLSKYLYEARFSSYTSTQSNIWQQNEWTS